MSQSDEDLAFQRVGKCAPLRVQYERFEGLTDTRGGTSAAEILDRLWSKPPVRTWTQPRVGTALRLRNAAREVTYLGPAQAFFQTHPGGPVKAAEQITACETEVSLSGVSADLFTISNAVPRTSSLFPDRQLMLKLADLGEQRQVLELLRELPWLAQSGHDGHFVPLHLAAFIDDADLLLTALECGCDPNAVGSYGMTALHWAACNASPALISRLLAVGARTNLENDYSCTPAELARMNGRTASAEAIESAEGNVDSSTPILRVFERYGVKMT